MNVISEEVASKLEALGWRGVDMIDEELTRIERFAHALRVLRTKIAASQAKKCREKILANLAAAWALNPPDAAGLSV
ncbi:MAG: hypothetical protein AAB634_02775 [Patescibacteria group bacterium]